MPTKFLELFTDGLTLKREIVTKFLGVFIDENITWKRYINTISTRISKSRGILYRARLIIPRKQLNQLCFSFFHKLCYLNYAYLAWGSSKKNKLSTTYRQQNH